MLASAPRNSNQSNGYSSTSLQMNERTSERFRPQQVAWLHLLFSNYTISFLVRTRLEDPVELTDAYLFHYHLDDEVVRSDHDICSHVPFWNLMHADMSVGHLCFRHMTWEEKHENSTDLKSRDRIWGFLTRDGVTEAEDNNCATVGPGCGTASFNEPAVWPSNASACSWAAFHPHLLVGLFCLWFTQNSEISIINCYSFLKKTGLRDRNVCLDAINSVSCRSRFVFHLKKLKKHFHFNLHSFIH